MIELADIMFAISLLLMVVFHEVGHAIIAKFDGIFLGFGFSGFGPCCRMKEPYNNRWKYLSGFAGGFLAFPVFALFVDISFYWIFFVSGFVLSLADLYLVIFFPKIERGKVYGEM